MFILDEISDKDNDFRTTCNARNVRKIYAFGALITKKSIGQRVMLICWWILIMMTL
jgi:hypothetical protein